MVSPQFEAVVAHALAALPDRYRAVVTLVDVEGLSYQEAADLLGVPRGTIMSRLHRARGRIRTQAGRRRSRSPEEVDVMLRSMLSRNGCLHVTQLLQSYLDGEPTPRRPG